MAIMAGALDEFGLISQLFAPLSAGYAGACNLTDDAAFILPEPGKLLTVTTDTMVEGVHFLPQTSAGLVARKLVRVNLSDLAAKGAKPFAVLLNLAVPKSVSAPWLTDFAAGLRHDLTLYDVALIGGDTVAIPGPYCLGLTAFGWADAAHCPHRSGAKAGDEIWVSGTIGDGGAGLRAAQGKLTGPQAVYLKQHYDLPEPRLALGSKIAPLVTACMDVSDGLVQDLGHICQASGLAAELQMQDIPLSLAFKTSGFGVEDAITMGDDYELLFTAPPSHSDQLIHLAHMCKVDITRIGRMMDGAGVICRDPLGRDVTPQRRGWQHFETGGPQE